MRGLQGPNPVVSLRSYDSVFANSVIMVTLQNGTTPNNENQFPPLPYICVCI